MDVPTTLEGDKGESQCYENSSSNSDGTPSSDIDDSFSDYSIDVRIHRLITYLDHLSYHANDYMRILYLNFVTY